MISEELKDIINKLNEQGKMAFLEAATEDQISQFEEKHKVELPEKYEEWLQHSDGGDCFLPAGVQLYGVSHNPLIDVDCNDRPDDSYVVIGALDTGDPVLFKKESEQISIYNQEAGRIEEDEVYDDFFAFLNNLYDLLGIEG
ncbi:MAG: SMI1/KNR4 family protein [Lachnospiraceae bacterium]|nr:SMI1/KNR4 family protein [Lachnospiraceae bacterium]